MQQYSSLSEQNSQIDPRSTLLVTNQQIRAELWLERSLNQLQNRLNDCLHSALATNQLAAVSEADIFQTVVNELHNALNTTKVAIALIQPKQKTCKVSFVSPSPSRHSQPLLSDVMARTKKLHLRLKKVINIEDLQYLANLQPPVAWQLSGNSGAVIGWLLLATVPLSLTDESSEDTWATLTSQLMSRAAQSCSTAILQLRNIQSLQQRCYTLEGCNQELERINHLKNQFLANTSHEIRTPLSSIIGFTHLLLARGYVPTQERYQEYLNIIQSSGKHLLALINDILDLSKIEANQLEVHFETVNVPTLCQNVLALIKEKAANKGLKLYLDLDPRVTTLVADPLRLKQMLLNLLFNALKFTNQGSVGLQVTTNGLFVHFTVWDTGTGISQEHQAELFKPYFQIAQPATGHYEGTGLGLTVTQKLAELHGGQVEVESEVEKGSYFTIKLPSKQEEQSLIPPSSPLSSSSVPTNFPTSNSNILLVEDDPPNAQMIQTYLEKLGYHVTWVKNAADMWQALKHLHPAVIVMDIYLPDSNDLQLVQQLRKHQHYHMIPVVAQTAMAMKGDRETCIAAGVNDYISKPIDLPLLASIVSKYSKVGHRA